MKKIGIDLDTTLNNLEQVWIGRYNKDYNDNIPENWAKWDLHELVKPECGEKIYKYLHEPKFFYNLDIKENAKNVFNFLSKYYELYIVTAYTADTCKDKTEWVKKQKLNIDPKNIIFINNKGLLKLDYLIDDGPHNFNNFGGIGLVFDMNYNRNVEDSPNRVRVKNWDDIKKFFEDELEYVEKINSFALEYEEKLKNKNK